MLILLAAITSAIWYILDYFYAPKHLANEPPLIFHSLPYIGHILGLLRQGTSYYETVSIKCKLPIYTLNVLNRKIYVVTSPDLVSAVDRQKLLAFNPFIAQIGKRITDHDQATSQIVQHNLNGENGTGYVVEVHDGTVAALAPGNSLENMTLTLLREISSYLAALESKKQIDFFAWTRKTITMCSTRAIYGPQNPFNQNPDLEEAFWDFDHDLNILMLNVASGIFAPKGSSARTKLGAAFTQYFKNYVPGKTQGSALIFTRYTCSTQHNMSLQNQGRLEVGTLIGILANTIPTIFYMLVHIYADKRLLRSIRNELENTSVSTLNPNYRSLMILSMRKKCFLLQATFQEVLRCHARGAGARYVREDVILNDQYLLRKGMIVQMPMAVTHLDPTIWGADVKEFKPERFLKKPNNKLVQRESQPSFEQSDAKSDLEIKQNLTGYRPFGGGTSLCPGRHFVTLETLALAACMVLRFDIEPVNGEEWTIPQQKQESLATNVFPPTHDLKVRVTRRRGFEDIDWEYVMT